MKSLRKMFIVTMILATFMTTAMTSFAAISFTDVSASYWGRQHIEKMAEKSIVSGMMENGKRVFKPEAFVSRVQALQMIFRTLRATNMLQSTENFTSKYETVMSSYNIPDWAYEAVAYALEYEIITGGELGGLMVGEQQVSATRQQVAVYLGKAIDTDPTGSKVSPITFVDRELIDTVAMPYVELLVKHKIISGDDKNYFNPRNTITRAQMTAICSKAYDVLEEEIIVEVPVPEPQPKPQETKTTTKLRTIDYVAIGSNTVFVKDDNDQIEIYELENSTEIIIDGAKRVINSLARGQRANFIFNENNKLVKIEVNPQENKYEGVIEQITLGDTYNTIVVRDDYSTTDRRRTFKIYPGDNPVIQLDGKNTAVKDLKREDQIIVNYEGDKVLRINAYSSIQYITGILETSVNFSRYPFILRVRVANNNIEEYEVQDNTTIRRNGRTVGLADLVRGDIIDITIEANKVTRIEATSINSKSKDEGIIQSITFGTPNRITILGKDREEITYDVDNNVSIYIDNTRSTVHDLRVGYDVELELQGNVITSIESKKVNQRSAVSGEIVQFHDSINRIIVKTYDASTRRYEEIPVFINSSTQIFTDDGKETNTRYLARNDDVFIHGRYDEDVFVATRIIVLND